MNNQESAILSFTHVLGCMSLIYDGWQPKKTQTFPRSHVASNSLKLAFVCVGACVNFLARVSLWVCQMMITWSLQNGWTRHSLISYNCPVQFPSLCVSLSLTCAHKQTYSGTYFQNFCGSLEVTALTRAVINTLLELEHTPGLPPAPVPSGP